MQFIVRYWSSLLPTEFRKADGSPRLVDYSIHPPTRLGLHNAMLSHHDRIEILKAHGGQYECEVYVVEGINSHVLTQELAISLFNMLPNGEVKWTTICKCLLPKNQEVHHSAITGEISHEQQLHLFEYTHESNGDTSSHHFDIDA
ncbi:MAG: hypothetical protein Q7S46_06495 [Gallionella sp.]|nr:hypothetical protein [Gallionella sp.]